MNYKLVAVIAVIGVGYAAMTGLTGIPFMGSETAFTPEKTFVYNTSGEDQLTKIYATDENSTHWKGTVASKSSSSDIKYRKFIVNKENFSTRSTGQITRSDLDSEDLDYSEGFFMQMIFPVSGFKEEGITLDRMTEPGTVESDGQKLEISETEYNGWKAYKYSEPDSSEAFYLSRTPPYIMLGIESGESGMMSQFELTEVRNGVNYPS